MWRRVASSTFERCPYTKAIGILQEALKNGKVFDPKDPEKLLMYYVRACCFLDFSRSLSRLT